MRRIDEAMREVLGEAITVGMRDPRVGFVTVTGVKTSPDLRHARVYVSVLGDQQQRAESLEALAAAGGYLQSRLAHSLRLKHTPSLSFDYDDSVDRGFRISRLLEEAAGERRDQRDGSAARETDVSAAGARRADRADVK